MNVHISYLLKLERVVIMNDMIKDDGTYQYKCYKELVPIDVFEVCYKDYMKYYEVVSKRK